MKRSGNPGRDNLNAFAEADIVSAFMVEVSKKMLTLLSLKFQICYANVFKSFAKTHHMTMLYNQIILNTTDVDFFFRHHHVIRIVNVKV